MIISYHSLMKIQSCFRDYNPDQLMLFPTDLKHWLPEDDLVYFLIDVVDELDLEPINREYTYRQKIKMSIVRLLLDVSGCK